MRLIAIDASPINGGPASYAVEVAALSSEAAGADVVRVRLYDLLAYSCTSCGSCAPTGRCTKRDGFLDHATRVMAGADALVVGAPARLSTSSQGAVALLRRLLGSFAGVSTSRGSGWLDASFAGRCAAVVASAATPLGLDVGLGGLGMAGAARRLLAEAHVTLVEAAPVPVRFRDALARDVVRERADALGRTLTAAASDAPRDRGRRARVSPLLAPQPVER